MQALDRVESIVALKGHGFSRAIHSRKADAALAAGGMCVLQETFPQGLKPGLLFARFAARLKSCPFKACEFKARLFKARVTARFLVSQVSKSRPVAPCVVGTVCVVFVCFAALAAPTARADTPAASPANAERAATLTDYRQHLVELNAVVVACAKARDTKSCDPALVGQDDRVPLSNAPNAERRLVRYNWLRALLTMAQLKYETQEKAQDKGNLPNENQDKSQAKPSDDSEQPPAAETTRPPKPTTSQLLQAAEARLTQDIAQADAMAAASPAPAADHANERSAMKQVLSGRDFRNLETSTARDTLLEKLGEWLNRLWESAAKLQARAAWVGRVIVWGFILAVCVGLAWGLLQLERRWRIRLVPESDGPAAGAASARDWQLWLADARRAAAAGAVARGDSLCLLGDDFQARIETAVARGPGAHSARVPGAGGRGRPAQGRTGHAHRQL